MNKLTNFDISQYLDSEEIIAEYLTQVLNDGNNEEFLEAIGYIAKAKGMSKIAKESGLGRESLYKSFTSGSKPRFETVMRVINSLGVKLKVAV